MSISLDSQSFEQLRSRRRAFEHCVQDLEVEAAARSLTDTYFGARLAVCPCCGYPSIGERANFSICSLCGWEDDGQDDAPTDCFVADEIAGGPNSDYSLTEARYNFVNYRQQYRPSDVRLFARYVATWPSRERIIRAYEALLPEADPVTYIDALPNINRLYKRLYEVAFEKPYPGKPKTREWYAGLRAREKRRMSTLQKLLRLADQPGEPKTENEREALVLPHHPTGDLRRLQEWYAAQCAVQSEYHGIAIAARDPGWIVEIDLAGTSDSELSLPRYSVQRSSLDWLDVGIEGRLFRASCTPGNLSQVLEIFLDLVEVW